MKRYLEKILTILLVLSVLLLAGFGLYVSKYYHADDTADALLTEEVAVRQLNNHLILEPSTPGDTALIFYPGGKVEYHAYLPLLTRIRDTLDITVILVRMPFNLAVFDADAAAAIMDRYPGITRWYLGGHSLGGAMAADFASKHPERVTGLILLGAYRYGDYPLSKTLTVYGSLNTTVAEQVDYTENVVVIAGGNHAQFGNYGPQAGDPPATISALEQQQITLEAIQHFLEKAD